MNSSASNFSYIHNVQTQPLGSATPISPRKIRKVIERKDSNIDLGIDLSEGSNESLTIQSCFSSCNDNGNGNSNGNTNGSTSYRRRGGKRNQSSPLPSYRQLNLSPIWTVVLICVCAATCCAVAFFFFEMYEDSHDAALRLQMRMDEIGPLSKEFQGKLTAIESENKQLKTMLEEEEEEMGTLRKRTNKEMPTLQEKIDRLDTYKQRTQASIQRMSHRRVLEKYGPGPHKVEVMLAFDPDSKLEGDATRFVLELAPVDDMPHAVHWFLEQVDNKLWDKCAFHRNANHVIQAGPVGNFLTAPNEGLSKKFKDSGFDSVLFQEYSDNYKHYKYTLGYAGRPGGPDFYINMQDNSRLHGPGGQGSYTDNEEADPCFSRVVEGFDAVVRMHQSDNEEGEYRHMLHNVAIQHMRLLPQDYTPVIAAAR
jgi:cyclophilin family peptidyl-prolyl cis-trans isomerase